jgi:uncharacterized protein
LTRCRTGSRPRQLSDLNIYKHVAMTRQAILELLTAQSSKLKAKYSLKSLAVFGSMARGDDQEESDVDVLVTFEGKTTFDNFMGLKLHLEDLFGRRVDLLTPKCLSQAMDEKIRKEVIVAP